MTRRLRTRGRAAALYGLGLIAVLVVPSLLDVIPGIAPGYVLYLVSLALIYAIVAIGLGLLIGHTGQISLGHAGFFAIGAYASALLTLRLGLPFVAALLVAGALTATIGFLLGLPALRLSGPYLAVATLGFGLAIPQLVVWQGSWTGGSSGLHGLPLASLQLGAFTLSALYAGIAGSLYAHLLHGISPEDFTVLLSVDFLTMIVLGGLGSVGGALSGALLLTFLQNALTRLPVVHDFKNLYIVVLGAILILTIAFLPNGLAGVMRSVRQRWAARVRDGAPRVDQIVELGEGSGVR